jgi:hypothetical protein
VRVVLPLTVCEHGREEAVVAEVKKGYDDLGRVDEEDIGNDGCGAEVDFDEIICVGNTSASL